MNFLDWLLVFYILFQLIGLFIYLDVVYNLSFKGNITLLHIVGLIIFPIGIVPLLSLLICNLVVCLFNLIPKQLKSIWIKLNNIIIFKGRENH